MRAPFYYILAILIFGISTAKAENYYLRNTGDNSATGNTFQQAWNSIEKLNSIQLKGGDTVFFEANQIFFGKIYLDQNDFGSTDHPIVITSYGDGRAIINAKNDNGLYSYNNEWIEIRKLDFIGSGALLNTTEGIFFYTDLNNGKKFEHILIDQVTVSGFGKSGLCLGSGDKTYPGFKDVKITKLKSENNETGMSSYDQAEWGKTSYAHRNLLIRDCEFLNCISSGLVLGGVDSGVIEYCRAANTGTTGKGVVALWAWSSRNLVFQYCIATGTLTSGPDGGGYDLDGGCDNCIVQYCYSGYNAGPGYMHCDYPWSRPTRSNTIRYCISENDGRKLADNRCSYLFISWGNGLEDCQMYNNTALISTNGSYSVFGLWGYIMTGYSQGDNPHIDNCSARNNIFYVKGEGHYLVSLEGGSTPIRTSDILLQGNCYYAEDSGSKRWLDNGQPFNSLDSWQKVTGQETLDGTATGYSLNPLLKDAGGAGLLANPHKMSENTSYQLEIGSGIIDKGLDLKTTFGTETGTYDFFGNPSLLGGSQDIGCFETQDISGVINNREKLHRLSVYPNPADINSNLTVISDDLICEISILRINGEFIRSNRYSDLSRIRKITGPSAPGCYLLKVTGKNGEGQIESFLTY
jgi:hypothetical protein